MTSYQNVVASHQSGNLFSLEDAFALPPSLGLIFRVSADTGSVWLALLSAWTLVDRSDLVALLAQEADMFVPLCGFFSIFSFIAYAGAGLYTDSRHYTL